MKRGGHCLEYVNIFLIILGLLFFLLVVPCMTVWGIVTGRLDIETLEPVLVQEQDDNG